MATIIDQRTLERCDYSALLKEVQELVDGGLSFQKASRKVARKVSLDRPESVIKGIRRQLERSPPKKVEEVARAAPLVPGLGVLYGQLAEFIKTLRPRVTGARKGKLFYDRAERQAEEVFAFLKGRIAALEAMGLEERRAMLRSVTFGLETLGEPLNPDQLWEADLRELDNLLYGVRDLLRQIDAASPGPSFKER